MQNFPKVKIIRSKTRGGLIKARLLGEEAAVGPILTFFDSHIEVTDGWLEPLLNRIVENPETIAVPVGDVINFETFAFHYSSNDNFYLAGFRFETLQFEWFSRARKNPQSDPSEPQPSPALCGSMFTVSKIGKFDPDLGNFAKLSNDLMNST
jgi:polypeptide N-acetylgalactosaminyltransferase